MSPPCVEARGKNNVKKEGGRKRRKTEKKKSPQFYCELNPRKSLRRKQHTLEKIGKGGEEKRRTDLGGTSEWDENSKKDHSAEIRASRTTPVQK